MKPADRNKAEGILYTDMYQLTMAQVYFRLGLHERPVQFEHFFRSYPDYGSHKSGYCVNAGLETLLDWMMTSRFADEDIEYLRAQKTRAGTPVFHDDFLAWLLENGNFEGITLCAIPEGRVVHPTVPLTLVQGPFAMAQILETALLNMLNFQTLIATKAARIHEAGRGRLLMEFGLRRAQGRASTEGVRAALIGGADYSSYVGASRVLGYPPKGTHAHSIVQAFMALGEGELGAFRAYAEIYPDDCLLLVDTINVLESGVPNAIRVFEELRAKGHEPIGIRLDSGDLAYLSIQAAKMLDEAGFPDTSITLSNNLDELVIWQIITQIQQEAPRYGMDPDKIINRLTYGVGTKLITSAGDPALDGVYKLVAVQNGTEWVPAIKVSESPDKVLNPGQKSVWRLYDKRGKATADLLALEDEDPRTMPRVLLHHPVMDSKWRVVDQKDLSEAEPLLVKVLDEGRLVYDLPTIEDIRRQREEDVERLDAGVKRLLAPHRYHVSLSRRLWDLKQSLIHALQQNTQ